MKALKQRSIDWAKACEGAPAEDFLEDMPLPAQLDEAVEVFCSAIERETFVTWEAVIRQEQGLPLSKTERKQLRSLMSFADEEDDRILWIDDLPRPRGPWYETLRTLAESLHLDVVDTVDCPAQVHRGGLGPTGRGPGCVRRFPASARGRHRPAGGRSGATS